MKFMNRFAFSLLLSVTSLSGGVLACEAQQNHASSPATARREALTTRHQRNLELMAAVSESYFLRAEDLIQAGASVSLRIRPAYDWLARMPEEYIRAVRQAPLPTLLMVAVAEKQPDLADLLLRKGAPVNARGDYLIPERESYDSTDLVWLRNVTALHIASFQGDPLMVNRLLKASASVDACDGAGHTALFLAVKRGSLPIVSRLIKAHCNVNLADKAGNVALKEAANRGRWELYDLLKRAGAVGDYDLRNRPSAPTP